MEHQHLDAAALERLLAIDRTVEQNEPRDRCQALRSFDTLSGVRRSPYTYLPRQTGRSGTVRTPQRAATPAIGILRPARPALSR